MFKEQIMHFPEPALMSGGLRRFGRLGRADACG
jgi:hypothetical protein